MKTNIKALNLVEKGLSPKTVNKLTESQINVLYSKLLGEQVANPNIAQKIKQDKPEAPSRMSGTPYR